MSAPVETTEDRCARTSVLHALAGYGADVVLRALASAMVDAVVGLSGGEESRALAGFDAMAEGVRAEVRKRFAARGRQN